MGIDRFFLRGGGIGAGSEGAQLQRANSQRYYLLPLPLAKYPIRIAAAEHAAMHGTTGG
ncbi:MAG: hypothetical protein VB814_07485 [Pirellulaceae bacterium]